MTTTIALQIAAILALILANGVFAMSEIAMLSARKTRLQQMAEEGSAGAAEALALLDTPNRFLSTVQIGITLVGVLAGAISGATIGRELGDVLAQIPLLAPYSNAVGVGLVVIVITYLTLLLGELVPKRLALNNPTGIAAGIARPMRLLARLTAPVVRFLSASTEAVLTLLGSRQAEEPHVTEEEVRMLIEQGARVGVFETLEREITERLFRLDDIRLSLLMTPRPEIAWLNVNDSLEENYRRMADTGYSFFPVADGVLDNILGIVAVKDLWASRVSGKTGRLQSHLRQPLFVPENTIALHALELMRRAGTKRALVINEFGGLEGLVTLDDLMEAIVGTIQEPDEAPEPAIVERENRTWLVDARLPADDLKETFGLDTLPGEAESGFDTVGGFVMMTLGHIPREAESFELEDLRFEVVDMDGYRVDKILVTRLGPDGTGEAEVEGEGDDEAEE